MQKVLTAEEMREVDRLTTEKYRIPSIILMENAAHAAARVITKKLGGSVKGKTVLVLCGKGNNGGDGAALARILWTQGADVHVYLFGKIEETKGEARTNFEAIKQISDFAGDFYPTFWEENNEELIADIEITNQFDILIDALFGTGLTRKLDLNLQIIFTFLSYKEKYPLFVSLDIPSGLNADLSQPIGENFQSDLTIAFTAPKLANVFPPASNFNGELVVANIGSPQELIDNSPSKLFVAEKEDAKTWFNSTKVKTNSYKKTRGTALIIAGSENYSGAAVLAANACFASGAGMTTVAVPKEIHSIVAGKVFDELIVKTIENIEFNSNVIGMGCGMSPDEKTHKFIRETVLNRQCPMVLDAQVTNAFSPCSERFLDDFPVIFTPHEGEFKRLLGREIREDRIAEAREFAEKHNVILVLKGERSLIAHPNGTVVINPTGNAGVSRAGAGDTLTGIITSFLAQVFSVKDINIDCAFEATVAALYIAGVAGDIAAEKFSQRLMTTTNVRECLQEAIERIKK